MTHIETVSTIAVCDELALFGFGRLTYLQPKKRIHRRSMISHELLTLNVLSPLPPNKGENP